MIIQEPFDPNITKAVFKENSIDELLLEFKYEQNYNYYKLTLNKIEKNLGQEYLNDETKVIRFNPNELEYGREYTLTLNAVSCNYVPSGDVKKVIKTGYMNKFLI
jgi:hypothetical protein